MVLRNQVEWALHCCSVLALQPDKYISTKDLAEYHGVPKEYLSKALQALAQAGLIEATLGPTGGYRLRKAPSQITFLDVVEAIEGKRSTFVCEEIRFNNPCLAKTKKKGGGVCEVAKVMYRADEAWRKELRAMNIATLADELREILPADLIEKSEKWFQGRK